MSRKFPHVRIGVTSTGAAMEVAYAPTGGLKGVSTTRCDKCQEIRTTIDLFSPENAVEMDHCESDDGVWNRSPPKKRYIAALQNFCTNIQYINTTSALDFERLITLKFRIREQEIPLKVLEISYFFSFSYSMAESPPKKRKSEGAI